MTCNKTMSQLQENCLDIKCNNAQFGGCFKKYPRIRYFLISHCAKKSRSASSFYGL